MTNTKDKPAAAAIKDLLSQNPDGLREIVDPGRTGLTARPEDPDDLAAVLGRLIDDPALRRELGQNARAWVLEERTWARNGARYRELFERLGVA